MFYMVIESFKEGAKEKVYERYREKGRMLPDGLDYVDSWLEANGPRCFQLMRSDDPALFGLWTAQWADLVQFEIVPLVESPTKME
jgi:hypothetical protein